MAMDRFLEGYGELNGSAILDLTNRDQTRDRLHKAGFIRGLLFADQVAMREQAEVIIGIASKGGGDGKSYLGCVVCRELLGIRAAPRAWCC